jgi:4-amino-4-deoxychorismate mutase
MSLTTTGRTVRTRRAGGAARTSDASAGATRPTNDTSGLEPFRARLDAIDNELARLFGERFDICRAIALHKRANAIPMMQPDRVAEVRERYLARGTDADLPGDFTAALFELTIAATCKMEDELIDGADPVDDAEQVDGTAR